MALPGLSFEIVRSAGPVLGLRADRTALLTLAERGPPEIPVLVQSHDEFVERFGSPVDGMLGPLLTESYFENGGQQLVVARFVPGGAARATGQLPLAGVTPEGIGATVDLSAREPGAFGNGLVVEALLAVRKRAKGRRPTTGTLNRLILGPLTARVFTEADQGLPVLLAGQFTGGSGEAWMLLVAAGPLVAGEQVLTFSRDVPDDAAADPDAAVVVQLFERSFTLQVRERGRPDVLVPGVDLGRPLDELRELLQSSPVTIDALPVLTGAELPLPGMALQLAGGALGLDDLGGAPELQLSFQRALAALELSPLPDVMVAPDLWSRIFRTKGITLLAFDADRAIALGDEMVESAARTLDRVVLLDPPLVDDQLSVRPMTVTELESWRAEREVQLPDNRRDFVAAYTPWLRIVAGVPFRGDDTLLVPPSLTVAGQMALTARERGPWNPTGNVALEKVVGLADTLTVAEQERLQDVGINPLRVELPRGATIQGVRSLSWPDRKPWRFLSTRRLFNYLRRALRPIGLSYTFEPNGPATWIRLRRDVERLLGDLFDAGALAGSVPDEAFAVKVDQELNPESERDNGVLVCAIAVAPAFPLEFLEVRLVVANGIAKVTEEPLRS